MSSAPFWAEAIVAALLVASGVFVVISAVGFIRLRDFFLRMHPPALAYTFGSWTVALAGIVYFSASESRVVLYPWLIVVILSITVPVTTVLLSRVALFRRRLAAEPDTPPPLGASRRESSFESPFSGSGVASEDGAARTDPPRD